jgi:nitroreductase
VRVADQQEESTLSAQAASNGGEGAQRPRRTRLDQPLADVLTIAPGPVRLRLDAVPDDVLLACLDAAAAAVSAEQIRYELVVVTDPEVKHQLARIYRQGWGVYKRLLRRRGRPIDARQWEADHFEEVPVVVVGCARGLRPLFPAVGAARFYSAVLPPMQNLLLAARAQGLAAALSSLPVWSVWQTRRTLQLPWTITPVALATLGWPVAPLPERPASPHPTGVTLDRHGHPYPASR